MNSSPTNLLPTFLAAVGLVAPAFAVPPSHDQITLYQRTRPPLYSGGILVEAKLPDGPVAPARHVYDQIDHLLALPSGRMLATTQTEGSPHYTVLNELLGDGTLRRIGQIEGPAIAFSSDLPLDMALDDRGRVYMVLFAMTDFLPHVPGQTRLIEIDPETGATLSSVILTGGVGTIATGPGFFWAAEGNGRLNRFDRTTGAVTTTGLTIDAPGDIDQIATDSAGRIWYLALPANCGSNCVSQVGSFDPATGVSTPAPAAFSAQSPKMRELTIRRGCFESDTIRCLQQGRYRAEIEYVAYDGAAGRAQAAPARSADTAIFSFFDPDNWELMVKVLDGCAINGHVWVYAAASTDVGYEMTITDTWSGVQKTYSNTLGHVAETVTDGLAFPCS